MQVLLVTAECVDTGLAEGGDSLISDPRTGKGRLGRRVLCHRGETWLSADLRTDMVLGLGRRAAQALRPSPGPSQKALAVRYDGAMP